MYIYIYVIYMYICIIYVLYIFVLYGPTGWRFLISEVPLYPSALWSKCRLKEHDGGNPGLQMQV